MFRQESRHVREDLTSIAWLFTDRKIWCAQIKEDIQKKDRDAFLILNSQSQLRSYWTPNLVMSALFVPLKVDNTVSSTNFHTSNAFANISKLLAKTLAWIETISVCYQVLFVDFSSTHANWSLPSRVSQLNLSCKDGFKTFNRLKCLAFKYRKSKSKV